MNDAHKKLLKVLSQCSSELRAVQTRTRDEYADACSPSKVEYRKIDWGHVGDAKRLLADLRDIRSYWVPNTVAR